MEYELLDTSELHELAYNVTQILIKDPRFEAYSLLTKTKNFDPYIMLREGALVLDSFYHFIACESCTLKDTK